MIDNKVWKTVLAAVHEYNNTVHGKNGEVLRTGSYEEKRGIFYNALRRSFATYMKEYRLIDNLYVSSFSCYFRPDSTLEKFILIEVCGRSWAMDNETFAITEKIRRYGKEGFLNNVINVDVTPIKDFKFHF